jgi:predicted Zn-dependent peptidase
VKQSLFSTTLDNGLTLLGEHLPGLESAAVAFHAPAGAIHDGPGRCGLATLAGEMCLRGAGERTSREVVEAFEMAGVQWSQAVSSSHASFSGAMVARQIPAALPIYADILRRPLLPEEEFENARQMILQNLAGTEDDPAHRTLLALRQLHYPSPWGMPSEGVSVDVERLVPDDVRRFLSAHMRPDGAIVAIAGRIDWDDFVARIDRLLGDWSPAAAAPVVGGSRGAGVRHVPHDSQQTHVALGWSVPPYRCDESYEATAALAILGGGSSSRLFTEVRERRGLCYSVSAGYQTHRDFAMAVCYAGTTAARAQETLDVMRAEIDRLPGTITADEVERVKARAKSGLVMQQESSAARAGAIARQWYHLGCVRTLAEELARYDRLTAASIEGWLADQPPRDLSVVSLGREPLEVPGAVPA